MSSDGDKLPKQELLIKLLKMTTAGDAEALVAIRKANELLRSAGWDWEKLIHGKIVVVGDPFSNLKAPPVPEVKAQPRHQPQAAPQPQTPRPGKQPWFGSSNPWEQTPPPSPPPSVYSKKPSANNPLGIGPNKFEGHCYCCGKLVAIGGGFFFKPQEWHHRATSSFKTTCTTCNTSGHVGPSAAPRVGPGARKITADDLS